MTDIKLALHRLSNIKATFGSLNPVVGEAIDVTDYQTYILSDQWKRKRLLVLNQRNHHCERCRLYTYDLHIHHKTYERLGCERWSDLEVLCEYCHSQHHGYE